MSSKLIEHLLAQAESAFALAPEFRLSGLMCHASAPDNAHGELMSGRISRSLHCENPNWFSFIQVHGPPRSTESRRVVSRFVKAGYLVKGRFRDEVLLHRGLRSVRDVISEVRFFELLGDIALPPRWPTRIGRAPVHDQKKPSGAEILAVVDTARSSSMTWDDVVVGHSQSTRWTLPNGNALKLDVHADAVALSAARTRGHLGIFASVVDGDMRLPRDTVKSLVRDFALAGYEALIEDRAFRATILVDGLASLVQFASNAVLLARQASGLKA